MHYFSRSLPINQAPSTYFFHVLFIFFISIFSFQPLKEVIDEEKRMLDEVIIDKAIIKTYFNELIDNLRVDVVIVGAGPSGMIAAYYLAKNGAKVTIFEKKLSIGGGIWGGGMGFNKIVVQEKSKEFLNEFGINYKEFQEGYYVADSIEATTAIGNKVVTSGVKIFNLIQVEDLSVKNGRVNGIVINWTPVKMTELHVDPLTVEAQYVIDSTGHDADVVSALSKREKELTIHGEGTLYAEKGEEMTVKNTQEVYPGLFVTGMAANAVAGGPRMGPIFGGMFLSGKKAAKEILKKLEL